MKIISIQREYGDNQTLGRAWVWNDRNWEAPELEFHTLELPWRENKTGISCIQEGMYRSIRHVSPKFGECLWLQDVPGRSEILIHPANYVRQLRGCIAPGLNRADIDGDGKIDVTSSRSAMRHILKLVGSEVYVSIFS